MPDTFITATGASATTNFDKTVTALVRRQIMDELRNKSIWMQPGSYIPGEFVPGTTTMRHVAYRDLSVTTNSNTVTQGTQPWLTEGTPPSVEALTINYDEYTAGQAGRLVGITDVALRQSPHRLFEVASERISENARQTADLYVGTLLCTNTGRVIRPNGRAAIGNIVAGDVLAGAIIRQTVAILKKANVPMFPDGTYHAVINPYAAYDLMADTATGGWLDTYKYASPSDLLNAEIGKYAGVRFMESNVANENLNAGSGSTVDVYSTVIFGPDTFAFGDTQTIETYMVRPGGDHADPLAQKALVGWKGMWGAKVLNINGYRHARIESSSSLGTNT